MGVPDGQGNAPGQGRSPKSPGVSQWQHSLGHGAGERAGRVPRKGLGLTAPQGDEGAVGTAEGLGVTPQPPRPQPRGLRHPCPSNGCPPHGGSRPHRGAPTPQKGPQPVEPPRPGPRSPHPRAEQPHRGVPNPQRDPHPTGEASPTAGPAPRSGPAPRRGPQHRRGPPRPDPTPSRPRRAEDAGIERPPLDVRREKPRPMKAEAALIGRPARRRAGRGCWRG